MKTNIDPVWRRYEKQFLFFKIKNRKISLIIKNIYIKQFFVFKYKKYGDSKEYFLIVFNFFIISLENSYMNIKND